MKTNNFKEHQIAANALLSDMQELNNPEDVKGNVNNAFDHPSEIEGIFSSTTKPISFNTHNSIYFEGDAAQSVYFIEKGMIKLISYLPNGRARIVRILGNGSIFGLEGLLREAVYKHSAVAVGNVSVYRVAVTRVRSLMQQSAELTTKIIEHWHNHLFYADTWITQFSSGAIKSRVARLVNFLGFIEYGQHSPCVRLLTCEEMAEVLGVTPESVSRVLAQFKRDRILSHLSFEVYERDKNRLQAVAGF
jgi:CRP/FNR family transcriptional regulator